MLEDPVRKSSLPIYPLFSHYNNSKTFLYPFVSRPFRLSYVDLFVLPSTDPISKFAQIILSPAFCVWSTILFAHISYGTDSDYQSKDQEF